MDSWKTKYLFPAMGMIPIDRSGGEQEPAALDAAERCSSAGSCSGSSPRAPAAGRRPAQGPHRRGPSGDEDRLPDLPGRNRRHRLIQPPDAKAPKLRKACDDHDRPAGRPERYAAGPRAPGVAVDDRRGDVRDPRDDRADVREHLRRASAETEPTVEAKVAGRRRPRRPPAADGAQLSPSPALTVGRNDRPSSGGRAPILGVHVEHHHLAPRRLRPGAARGLDGARPRRVDRLGLARRRSRRRSTAPRPT